MAAHPKPHPLAHRIVVPNGFLRTGETVRVIDWLDRCGDTIGAEIPGRSRVSFHVDGLHFTARWCGEEPIAADMAVAVARRTTGGALILHARDLPTYDPVPVGYVS